MALVFACSISHNEFDHIAADIKYNFVHVTIDKSRIGAQQHRIRESQWRIETSSTVMCQLKIICRQYHVNGPQALWHTDGNHKLIR